MSAVATVPIDFRSTYAYDFTMRLLGSLWFLLLAVILTRATIASLDTMPWFEVASRMCLAAFYLILWFLVFTRPPARTAATGLLPRLAAFAGTYMPWTITFATPSANAAPNLLSTIFVATGTVMVLITIWHLGRSFSIVPQARTLVQSGPYRLVRHPLYLAEEIALLGVVLQFLSPLTVMILVAHLSVQVPRILYEEKLLRQTFPDYGASRWRLIPFVW